MNLQNYIEEEIKELSKHGSFCLEKDCECNGIDLVRQSLHRIAKITAEEIVPEKKKFIDDEEPDYNQALSDLQTKIKEFIK